MDKGKDKHEYIQTTVFYFISDVVFRSPSQKTIPYFRLILTANNSILPHDFPLYRNAPLPGGGFPFLRENHSDVLRLIW